MAACVASKEKFEAAMDDDLNTADAISAIFELVREIHRLDATNVSREAVTAGKEAFLGMADVLGLLMKKEDGLDPEVQALVDERAEARKNKDWKRSDELRDQIKALGYILEDTAAGQKVRKGV
jgi:cysteinyl-tRNA synthetase